LKQAKRHIPAMPTAASTGYTSEHITVLEGLEPVRRRPGMYIGGTDARGYHHLLWEIVDNSVDEVINGYGSHIQVTLHKDHRSATVVDDGRGIPVDVKKEFKKSALELVLTTLHAGGKFSSSQYQFSGGLHGVGSSVVNALSEELVATVKRDGAEWRQSYARGKPTSKVGKIGPARGTGTSILFRPDSEIFGKQGFDAETIRYRLDTKAFLHKGLKITFRDEDAKTTEVFEHAGGIADFLTKLVADRGKAPTVPQVVYVQRDGEQGFRLEAAMQWTESPDETLRSYVNGIPTTQGGTHEQGLRSAVVKAMRSFMDTANLTPKGTTISAEDVREGIVCVLSIYMQEPQFQGQTKERLGSPEVQAQVDNVIRAALEKFLLENRTAGAAIVERVALAAKAREASRAASQAVSRKTAVSHRLNLPGKLADCSSTDPAKSELFIVEGDSAGGSAKQGRERKTQAILPLRGKVLNTEQASLQKVLLNKELQDVVSALGCGVGADFKVERLRYHKIVLLMDADSDGHHIATLLLTFFYRHLRPLIEQGYVYLAQPPLFRIDHGKETHWALDEGDRDRIVASLPKNARPEVMRFKGLGEMQPEELKRTTLDPATRRFLRVRVVDGAETDRILGELMGKDVEARFRFIMERSAQADLDI
jgi:DNA topoisomerase IV B subunit